MLVVITDVVTVIILEVIVWNLYNKVRFYDKMIRLGDGIATKICVHHWKDGAN